MLRLMAVIELRKVAAAMFLTKLRRSIAFGLLFIAGALVCAHGQIAPEPAMPQLPAPPTTYQKLDGEYVIITGGVSLMQWEKFKAQPHDNWWLNFIRASRIRIAELRNSYGPDARITWLLYTPAYKRRGALTEKADLFSIIRSIPEAYGVKFVPFSSTSELVAYLNNRDGLKIAGLEYFGHSNRACWMFDYSNEIDSASKAWLHEDDLSRIKGSSFARNAYIRSWGCHTGESMSKKFQEACGKKMIGAVGKTQYMTDTLPIISTPGGRWYGL